MPFASPEAKRAYMREYQRRRYQTDEFHRLKQLARVAATNAIKAGKLIPQPCEKCGHKDVQAHHDDYTKPLDVRWLCVPCHRDEHDHCF